MAKCVDGCTCGRHVRRTFPFKPKSEEHKRKISEALKGKPKSDAHKAKLARAKTHGYTKHPQYLRHRNMMKRCYDPTNIHWDGYGGRRISVHSDWHNPVTFCDWVDANLGPCPPGYSIDRIDGAGDYEPGNVRWASASQQAYNRRSWAGTGMKHSPEHKRKISEALKNYWAKRKAA